MTGCNNILNKISMDYQYQIICTWHNLLFFFAIMTMLKFNCLLKLCTKFLIQVVIYLKRGGLLAICPQSWGALFKLLPAVISFIIGKRQQWTEGNQAGS